MNDLFIKHLNEIFYTEDIRKNVNEMSVFTPTVRGKWNKKKILRYLKNMRSTKSEASFWKTVDSLSSFEEFKNSLYWHGSPSYISGGLKPSITFSKRWVDSVQGGGGYGLQYWTISVSKSKKMASTFSGNSRSVLIYPVIIKPNSKIVDKNTIGDIKDSDELEEYIEELWNKGIDALWIGGGEQELAIVNPNSAVIGEPSSHGVFGISMKDPTDEELLQIWESREKKLQTIRNSLEQRRNEKQQQKLANTKDYEELMIELNKKIDDYKKEKINVRTLIDIFRKTQDKGVQILKYVEMGNKKREIMDLIKSKENFDIYAYDMLGR